MNDIQYKALRTLHFGYMGVAVFYGTLGLDMMAEVNANLSKWCDELSEWVYENNVERDLWK